LKVRGDRAVAASAAGHSGDSLDAFRGDPLESLVSTGPRGIIGTVDVSANSNGLIGSANRKARIKAWSWVRI
jgi:hypothetical protein